MLMRQNPTSLRMKKRLYILFFLSLTLIGQINSFELNPVEGCLDTNAINYNPIASIQAVDQWGNTLCIYSSCTDVPHDGCVYDNSFSGWNQYFGPDECSSYNGTPCILGCTDSTMSNYNVYANTDNNSCITWQNYAIQLENELYETDQCLEVISEIISLQLPMGWSMFGYTCKESIDVVTGFNEISDEIALVKDDFGAAYLPEWNYNGLGNLQFAKGYQIKMHEQVDGFYFCATLSVPENDDNDFIVGNDYLLKNNIPYNIKGIVYVPGQPGFLPYDMSEMLSLPPEVENRIFTDIINIKDLGANTIRFWNANRYCYEVLQNIGGLNFIETIWIDNSPDFQNIEFKETIKLNIRQVVDRVYSVFTDNSPPLIAFILGSELVEESILATDTAHPEINNFNGNYITTTGNVTATEAFLAEMADYLKTYEFNTYNNLTLVSYSNEIRTADILDTPFLDFRSFNLYSDAIASYLPNTTLGSTTGTLFQGYIEELKSKFPDKPLLISETGLSVSPSAVNVGPPNYGYGGNTEQEQATGIIQNINDINMTESPTAGVVIHEYSDAWWKWGLSDSNSQDPEDVQEWFGLVRFQELNDSYTIEFRPSYIEIQSIWSE